MTIRNAISNKSSRRVAPNNAERRRRRRVCWMTSSSQPRSRKCVHLGPLIRSLRRKRERREKPEAAAAGRRFALGGCGPRQATPVLLRESNPPGPMGRRNESARPHGSGGRPIMLYHQEKRSRESPDAPNPHRSPFRNYPTSSACCYCSLRDPLLWL